MFLCRSEGSASRGLTDKSAPAKLALNQVNFCVGTYARTDSAHRGFRKRPALGANEAGPVSILHFNGRKAPIFGLKSWGNRSLTWGLSMKEDQTGDSYQPRSQTAHRLKMSPAAFRALSLALHNLSSRELELCSPRRLLTTVLSSAKGEIFHIPLNVLDCLCHHDALVGEVPINIRVDSTINDRMRDFREEAGRRLGRSVSVIEAINACAHVLNEGL